MLLRKEIFILYVTGKGERLNEITFFFPKKGHLYQVTVYMLKSKLEIM